MRGGAGTMDVSAKRKDGGAAEETSTRSSNATKDKPPASGGKGGGKGKGKGKDAPPALCGWCGKPGAKRRCSQCRSEAYCDRDCQRVSACREGGGALGDCSSPPPPFSPPLATLDTWAQEDLHGFGFSWDGSIATPP